jgi:uncharacterized RDD family membrane protein YckC
MPADRVGELLENLRRGRRVLLSPEGVALDVLIAGKAERLGAFLLDALFMVLAILFLFALLVLLVFAGKGLMLGMTLILFLAFVVRNLYFLHFELAWQGRTPGKKIFGLRVISRNGGELRPSAIIARNLTREVELFLPLSLLLTLNTEQGFLQQLALLGWILAITILPLCNREHLRAGDLIGGTLVIAMPKRVLLQDLTAVAEERAEGGYVFTPGQLEIYGAFELQVLEEFLRRPDTEETRRALAEVCGKICRKIAWEEPVPPEQAGRFLRDFYAAERAKLERGQLFGRFRADKTSAPGGEKKG